VGPHRINRWHSKIITHSNSHGQQWSHRLMVTTVGLLCLAGCFRYSVTKRLQAWLSVPLIIGVVVYFIYLVRSKPSLTPIITGLCVTLFTFTMGNRFGRRNWSMAWGSAVVLLFVLATLPGVWARVDWSREHWDAIELYQMHLSITQTAGERLSQGGTLFGTVFPYYGMVHPVLVACWSRWLGEPDIGQVFQLARIVQALFVVGFLASYFTYSKRQWFAALIPSLFVIGLYHFNFHLLPFPNHHATRHAATLVAPATLLLISRWNFAPSALTLGWVMGLCLFNNLETGVAFSIGTLAYLYRRFAHSFQAGWFYRAIGIMGLFVGGLALAVLLFSVLVLALLGTWLPADWPSQYITTLVFISSSGYSGLPFAFHAFAVAMFFHASVVAIGSFYQPNSFRTAFRLAIATMILVWFAYYANRPQAEKLYSHALLYGFLVVDVMRTLANGTKVGGVLATWGGAMIMTVAFIPYGIDTIAREIPYYRMGWHQTFGPSQASRISISGIDLPTGARTEQLLAKAKELRQFRFEHPKTPIVYFTLDAYLVPKISGVWSASPFADTLWESINQTQFDFLMRWLHEQGPDVIWTDGPLAANDQRRMGPIRVDYVVPGFAQTQRDFYRFLEQQLSKQYEPVETGAWVKWKRRASR
jgi:hypothetical protein